MTAWPPEMIDAFASRIWFENLDRLGWPNENPTWRELTDMSDEVSIRKVTRIRDVATKALEATLTICLLAEGFE